MILPIVKHKNEKPGFRFLSTPKKVLTKISHPKKVTKKFQTQKKSLDRKFQTQKRALHIPVTYIPEYPPWGTNFHNIPHDGSVPLLCIYDKTLTCFDSQRYWFCSSSSLRKQIILITCKYRNDHHSNFMRCNSTIMLIHP